MGCDDVAQLWRLNIWRQWLASSASGANYTPVMTDTLSFEVLEQRLRAASPDIPIIRKTKPARGALLVGGVGALVALLGVNAATGSWRGWLVVVGLVAELGGFAIYLIIELRHELPKLREARLDFARDLENEFGPYTDLLRWLTRFGAEALERRAVYLRQRQTIMASRFSVIVGAVEKLGVLPVLAALYLQMRDMGFPPELGLWEGVFALILISMYLLCLWLVGFKRRLDLYVGILEAALHEAKSQALVQPAATPDRTRSGSDDAQLKGEK